MVKKQSGLGKMVPTPVPKPSPCVTPSGHQITPIPPNLYEKAGLCMGERPLAGESHIPLGQGGHGATMPDDGHIETRDWITNQNIALFIFLLVNNVLLLFIVDVEPDWLLAVSIINFIVIGGVLAYAVIKKWILQG